MINKIKNKVVSISALVLGLLVTTSAFTWSGPVVRDGYRGGPSVHDGVRVYNRGGYGYYNRGGYYYGPRSIIVPNVVINVPVERPYPSVCEEVEVCDNYTGECWLDRLCR